MDGEEGGEGEGGFAGGEDEDGDHDVGDHEVGNGSRHVTRLRGRCSDPTFARPFGQVITPGGTIVIPERIYGPVRDAVAATQTGRASSTTYSKDPFGGVTKTITNETYAYQTFHGSVNGIRLSWDGAVDVANGDLVTVAFVRGSDGVGRILALQRYSAAGVARGRVVSDINWGPAFQMVGMIILISFLGAFRTGLTGFVQLCFGVVAAVCGWRFLVPVIAWYMVKSAPPVQPSSASQ